MFDPKSDPPTTGKMVGVFCKITVPSICTNVLAFLTGTINAVIAGRMNDPSKLAAVGLANVCHAVMVLSLMIGLNCAQETLTSQAFGAGNIRLCGIYLNRGRFILIAFFIPLALIPAIFAEDILLAIGQDSDVARLTHTQIWYGLPAIFCYAHYDLYKRWLACMRITLVPMIAMIVATLLHLPLCLLFINVFDMDIRGLGLASSVKDFVLLTTVMLYGNCSKDIRPALSMPDRETFRGWGEYLKVSLPSTAMICAEWWSFETLTVIAGILGVNQQASQVIIFSVSVIVYMAPLGI